jgi:hypothetical protein
LLLILTGVADGTIDFVIDYLDEPFFRFNLDDFGSYEFQFSPDSWSIRNPTGLLITNETASRCLWWKLFLYQLNDDKYVKEEIRMAAQNLYSWFLARKLVIGNPPYLEASWGKLRQATVAQKYFQIPKQLMGWGKQFQNSFDQNKQWIVKSMSSQLTESGKAIFTTEVDPEQLDSNYPWYIQEKIVSDFDITVLVVGQKYFAFSRSRKNLKSLDWRKEQFSDHEKWNFFQLSEEENQNIRAFVKELNISWGRMDFLLVEGGLVFLEINPNGQWVFLDPANEHGVISSVANFFLHGETH